jgi:hypothetical protein
VFAISSHFQPRPRPWRGRSGCPTTEESFRARGLSETSLPRTGGCRVDHQIDATTPAVLLADLLAPTRSRPMRRFLWKAIAGPVAPPRSPIRARLRSRTARVAAPTATPDLQVLERSSRAEVSQGLVLGCDSQGDPRTGWGA